uniref:Uncharacterized protein n=1 Tax=Helicotheca tamesis TaxID=374047 RepID=A0A7S2IGE7_9STRA|mmetsp:Transcript_8985/g.12434  ORF Transcript_8985/g.12434 Transcript_8985/m.12434 type:complete len:241 (+) Transcript_8985:93-815(+)
MQTSTKPIESLKVPPQSAFGHSGPKLLPLNPLLVISLIPLLPTYCFINRGFTIWFHWVIILYLLTSVEFLRRFLIFLGVSISAGWYAAIANDFLRHSRFCDILYMNMPEVMLSFMTDGEGNLIYTTSSLCIMALSHALDTFLHPGVTYLLWRAHCRSGGTVQTLMTWPVIVSTFIFSRFWSCFHIYYNSGKFGVYYFGHDIYILNNLDSFLPSYASEGVFFLGAVVWKISQMRKNHECCH